MTSYYVDPVHGADANNGLGPDASHATNKPWKTIAKALGAAGIASGDTVNLSPSGWYREVVSVAMTSAVAETFVLGDPWNRSGFKSAAGARVEPGPVVWTAWLTDEKTAPSTTPLLNLAGRDHLTFRNLLMFGANATTASCVLATTLTSTDISFRDCAFMPFFTRPIIDVTAAFATALNWTIDRCYFGATSGASGVRFTGTLGVGSDYDINARIRNSIFWASGATQAINLNTTGSGANRPGGLVVNANTFIDCRAVATGASTSAAQASQVADNIIVALANIGITAGAANSITEDYNVIWAGTETSGTMSHGGHSQSGDDYALTLNFGFDRIWAPYARRPILEPLATAPGATSWLRIIGNSGFTTGNDIEDYVRPQNTQYPGAYGLRHNIFRRDPLTPFADDGSNLTSSEAFSDFAFVIPVDVGVTYTISIDMQYDSGYDATPYGKPAAELVANPRIGFAGETKTMTAAANTPETLTFSAFVPVDFNHDCVILRVLDNDDGAIGGSTVKCGNLFVARS